MISHRSTQILGLLVFLLGVVLLVTVFFLARADLHSPLTGTAAEMSIAVTQRIGMLFIMGYAASSLAGRGCQMFQASNESKEQ